MLLIHMHALFTYGIFRASNKICKKNEKLFCNMECEAQWNTIQKYFFPLKGRLMYIHVYIHFLNKNNWEKSPSLKTNSLDLEHDVTIKIFLNFGIQFPNFKSQDVAKQWTKIPLKAFSSINYWNP